jgi:hypothetical protein
MISRGRHCDISGLNSGFIIKSHVYHMTYISHDLPKDISFCQNLDIFALIKIFIISIYGLFLHNCAPKPQVIACFFVFKYIKLFRGEIFIFRYVK